MTRPARYGEEDKSDFGAKVGGTDNFWESYSGSITDC